MGFNVLFVVLAVTLSVQMTYGADPTVTLVVSTNAVKLGEPLTISCSVFPHPDGSFVHWTKELGTDVDLIGTSSSLQPPYNKRYTAKITASGSTRVYTLNIPAIEKEDSGHIKCQLPAGGSVNKTQAAEVDVNVVSNVDTVRFFNYTAGESIVFTEGVPQPMICIMNGTTSEPKVQVKIGETDYSNDFKTVVYKKQECGGAQGTRTCFLHTLNTIRSNDDAFYASWRDHGKTMRCEAVIPELDTKAAELDVIVNYKPKFDCAPKLQVYLHKKAKVTCKVFSHPALGDVLMKVKLGQTITTLRNGSSVANEGLYFSEHDVMPGHRYSTVMLTIDEVFEKHLIPYSLEATNALGSSTFQITLTDKPVGASSMLTASITLLGLCAALLFKFL